jgi:hypothetical protein
MTSGACCADSVDVIDGIEGIDGIDGVDGAGGTCETGGTGVTGGVCGTYGADNADGAGGVGKAGGTSETGGTCRTCEAVNANVKNWSLDVASKPEPLLGYSLCLENEKAGFALVTLDGKPVESSAHMVITAMGDCINSGMRMIGSVLVERGGPPVLYDDVRGAFTLETSCRSLTAYGLSECGERSGAPLHATRVPGGFEVRLGGYAHYELTLEP